jgi:hypothetical protein
MTRNLDPTLAAGLSAGLIQPVVLVELTFNSGIVHVWSGLGDLVWNGNTYSGVGNLGSIGPIGEGSAVKADGTTVTLSGIGLSSLDIPGQPTPPDPPVTPPAGQSVAWAHATVAPTPGIFSNAPSIYNAELGCSGAASGGLNSGSLGMTNGQSLFGQNSIGLTWAGFRMPPEIPLGAVIAAVYPVVVVSSLETGGLVELSCGSDNFGVSGGTNVGTKILTIAGPISALVANSVPGPANTSMGISFVGFAVYYKGVPQSKTTLLYEALQDIRTGAPAKIWYGLMSSGSFLGTPYLIFSGQVDKPTMKASVDTLSITLALENRLVNLQRPNARRYTAADQRLYFPTDSAFNWVEILNDMALVWG